jgi:hypothetical protein
MPDLASFQAAVMDELREDLRCSENRALNADDDLRYALRLLGIGDNDAAAEAVKRARARLAGGEPAE